MFLRFALSCSWHGYAFESKLSRKPFHDPSLLCNWKHYQRKNQENSLRSPSFKDNIAQPWALGSWFPLFLLFLRDYKNNGLSIFKTTRSLFFVPQKWQKWQKCFPKGKCTWVTLRSGFLQSGFFSLIMIGKTDLFDYFYRKNLEKISKRCIFAA